MIADPNLVNAIEGLTRRLLCINLVLWIQLGIMFTVGSWFVFRTYKKDKEIDFADVLKAEAEKEGRKRR